MFGFGKKKKNNAIPAADMSAMRALTIPDIFYGGNDPEIYHSSPKETDTSHLAQPGKKKAIAKKSHTRDAKNKTIFSHKWVWVIASMVLLLAVAGISWYYLQPYFNQPQPKETSPKTPVIIPPDTQDDIKEEPPIVTSTPDSATSTPDEDLALPSLSSEFITFPQILTLNTSDLDSDGLTDIEEEVFNTDSGTWDTDEDEYYDGLEVMNLYNPQGFSPVRLIDSGSISEYAHPTVQYRVYYPRAWQRGSVDVSNNQVLFSSIQGDFIEIRVSQKSTQTPDFLTWFGRNAEGQRFNDLREFTSRFSVDGWIRKDNLVAYFEDEQYMYTLIYHSLDNGPIAYRQVMQMMYQSFRPSAVTEELPDQTPRVGTSTVDISTSTITTSTASNTITVENF